VPADFALSARSLQRLQGVHPDLVRVVKRAIDITDLDFAVLEGLRTQRRQEELVKAGASRTMNSRHLTGHAVDLGVMLAGELRWDWPLYVRLSKIVKQAARLENVLIEWGGDWRTFKDGPHYQLPWQEYPVQAQAQAA
jgi:peptidoglycan L-alanyl-D-glutamate endopeptidase CwlK